MAKRDGETPSQKPTKKGARPKRTYVLQTEVPSISLDQATRVPRAIGEQHAYRPTAPLSVAAAMNMQPNSGLFRALTGAALAYGLTNGGPNADTIAITPLGMRVVRPTSEGDDLIAKREALLRPRIVGEFLRRYDKAPLPREDIGLNVLVELGVARDRSKAVLALIVEGASSVGLLREIKGKSYVDLQGIAARPNEPEADNEEDEEDIGASGALPPPFSPPTLARNLGQQHAPVLSEGRTGPPDSNLRRVFITHGKNRDLVEPIKKLLGFGEMQPVISVEKPTVSQPVPDKVMGEMRSCGAAIIHVDDELTLLDKEAKEQVVLNPNVLIEIGAAMALYGRRFILLVKDGLKLPSNLQGLFEVRYTGGTLDGDATIRLLEAINDIKNHPIPDRYAAVPSK